MSGVVHWVFIRSACCWPRCLPVLLTLLLSTTAIAQTGALFSSNLPASSYEAEPWSGESGLDVGDFNRHDAVVRKRRAGIDFERLNAAREAYGHDPPRGGSLELNLFDDVRLRAIRVRSTPTSSGYALAGDLDGVPFGSVTLVVNGDVLAGTVRTSSAIYTIGTAADGSAVVRELDAAALPPPGEPLTPPPAPQGADSKGGSAPSMTGSAGATSNDELSFIDVLIVYTSSVVEAAGGRPQAEAMADLSIAEANQALADSGVQMRFFLTRAMEVDYFETGIASVDLERLQAPDDGHLDEVHEWRDATGADVVHLFVAATDTCGLAYVVAPKPGAAAVTFALDSYHCPYTLAHEIGHNLGLRHDRYADPSTPSEEYAHGYVNQAALHADAEPARRWRTIMAYSHQCSDLALSCPHLLRYSNPDLTYMGDALGVAPGTAEAGPGGPADARRFLNEGRMIASEYRPAVSDLIVDSGVGATTLRPGEGVRIEARVTNRGRIGAPATQGTYRISGDPVVDSGDAVVGRFDLSDVPGGEAITVSLTVEAPQQPGNHYFGTCVEPVETEKDLANNCSFGVHATVGPTVSVSDARTQEGDPLGFPVTLSEAREIDVDVSWETIGGQAVPDIDFRQAATGKLTIPAGASEGAITVETLADDAAEGDDTFGVRIVGTNPSSGSGAVPNIDGSAATGTILDDDGNPELADAQLADAIWTELDRPHGSPIGVAELEALTRLWASRRGIASLSGLEAATQLKKAWLWDNRLTDLRPLAHLVRLEQLILDRNPLRSLAPLAHLGSLADLRLAATGISELRGLEALRQLRTLLVWDNRIGDLSPLAGLTRLIELNLSGNRVANLSPLSGLIRLKRLFLDGNDITDLTPLQGLSRLQFLYLADNAISDIAALGSLAGIKALRLRGNRVADLSPLSPMRSMNHLELHENRITDVTPLAGLQNLSRLNLSDNAIRDIEPLSKLSRLTFLDVSNNEIVDLAPLASNAGLGHGDTLILLGNPLNGTAVRFHVPALRERGVAVTHIGVSVGAGSALEGRTISFPVRLSFPADEDLALRYTVTPLSATEAADYSDAGSGRLTIPAGTTYASIDLFTSEDAEVEPHEALSVTLSAPDEGLAGGAAIVGATAHGLIVDAEAPVADVPLFAPAGHGSRQGFVRIVNGGTAGAVRIDAIDDEAMQRAATLALAPGATIHLNSRDIEEGNATKGLLRGIGDGQGDWRLEVRGDQVEALTYMRTGDGFLTSLHDQVARSADGHAVPIFNPARNSNQVSLLRLTNPGAADAEVTVSGIDDHGRQSAGEARLTLAAGASRTLSAQNLESGAGLQGALGKGSGKWRLRVVSDEPIRVMNLLSSPTGHLANLSTVSERNSTADGAEGMYRVPLFPAAADPAGREGFVRVVNRGGEPATVRVAVRDDTHRSYDPVKLSLAAGAAGQFNSHDLESGNADKGLSAGVGAGEGDWRLELTSAQDIVVGAYVRTPDGFLTGMHDVVGRTADGFLVPTFNPARNVNQVSSLRVINLGTRSANVRVTAIDDLGRSPGDEVYLNVGRGLARTLPARVLEEGLFGLQGAIGSGHGKWRLAVASESPLQVMSLLESPTGHLTNLSTRPETRGDR